MNGGGTPTLCDTGSGFDSNWLLTRIKPPKRTIPTTKKYDKIGIRIDFSDKGTDSPGSMAQRSHPICVTISGLEALGRRGKRPRAIGTGNVGGRIARLPCICERAPDAAMVLQKTKRSYAQI